MKDIFKTQEALATAFSAYRKNNGYIKDTFRFSEPENKTLFSNKDLVKFHLKHEFRPEDFEPLEITEQDYESVDDAMKHFRRYTLGLIGDSLNDFQRDVMMAIGSDDVSYNRLGILSYVPELVNREIKENSLKKILRTEYRDSSYISDVGKPVEGVCNIIDKHYSSHYEKFSYTADYMGNIISFWTVMDVAENSRTKFKGKVKKHSKNRHFDVNETVLNYVKLYKV